MSMQDRAYAAAIFIILGLCCIGAYVALSGFMNANPEGIQIGLNAATATATAGVTIEIPTETAAPPTNTPLPATQTPEGFQPTAIPAATRGPTLDFIPTIPTAQVTSTPEATATPPGCGAGFCPRLGPPDPRAPTGNPCPANYLWGFVTDANGVGLPGIRVKFREQGGGGDIKDTKAESPNDPAGRYDFPAASGIWTVTVVDREESPLGPSFQVQAGQNWPGSGNCPTRVDFVQQ